MSETTPPMVDFDAIKVEWLNRLETLVGEVKGWVEASGWRTRRVTKTVDERQFGSYKVPVLLMEKDAVQVVLNPVARYMPGADGAVDLYLAPAYDDIATLYFDGSRWTIHHAPPPDPRQPQTAVEGQDLPFTEETIRTIIDRMIAYA